MTAWTVSMSLRYMGVGSCTRHRVIDRCPPSHGVRIEVANAEYPSLPSTSTTSQLYCMLREFTRCSTVIGPSTWPVPHSRILKFWSPPSAISPLPRASRLKLLLVLGAVMTGNQSINQTTLRDPHDPCLSRMAHYYMVYLEAASRH